MTTPLADLVRSVTPQLSAFTDAQASDPRAPGKWSKKQTLGHLIDSAANNHQRFVRLQLEPEITLPGYEQDGWVRVNRYQETPWPDLVLLWAAYNLQLARVIEGIPAKALGHVWRRPEETLTLEFIAADYITHLQHHLKQIRVTA